VTASHCPWHSFMSPARFIQRSWCLQPCVVRCHMALPHSCTYPPSRALYTGSYPRDHQVSASFPVGQAGRGMWDCLWGCPCFLLGNVSAATSPADQVQDCLQPSPWGDRCLRCQDIHVSMCDGKACLIVRQTMPNQISGPSCHPSTLPPQQLPHMHVRMCICDRKSLMVFQACRDTDFHFFKMSWEVLWV
jgi:hypothetical protein